MNKEVTMLIDVTLKITPKMAKDAQGNEKKALVGHLGTHFDVMNKEFPLDYAIRKGYVFDVSSIKDRDIEVSDIDITKIDKAMFIVFYTNFIEEVPYGTKPYYKQHPQLSHNLIDTLLEKEVALIGIDCAGVRRGKEHTPTDQLCADKGTFIIENMCNLKRITNQLVTIYTFPMSYTDISGLQCRIMIAKE